MRKQILFLLSLVLALEALAFGVSAHEVPDLQAGGTIIVTLHAAEEAADTGSLTFYHVAEIVQENGNYSYALTEAFAPSGLDVSDPNSPGLARNLAEYAADRHIPGRTHPVQNGKVEFPVAPGALGLYLVVQNEACAGYEKINPFVIGVPMYQDGAYRYEVDAAPKMGDLIPETTVPTEPTVPNESTAPTQPQEPGLPHTGQLNWPVPVLALAGLILFAIGWRMDTGSKENRSYEK